MTHPAQSRTLSILYRIRRTFLRLRQPLTLGVRCIVAREDGHVLLVRHSYIPGWHFPGGGVKRGESFETAVVRELFEEAGVKTLERPKLFHAYSNFKAWKSDYVLVYALRQFELTPQPNWEIAEHAFFPLDALPLETTAATRRRLSEWQGHGAPAEEW